MAGNIIHDGNLGRVWNRIKNLFVQKNEVGVADGVASLDSYGKIPLSQLPSTADDVIEGYYYNDVFYEDSEHTIPITGETGKIYIDITDGENKIYRYTSNDGYISIASGSVQSDWNQNDSESADYIKNKPSIFGNEHYSIAEGNENNVPSGWYSHTEGNQFITQNWNYSSSSNAYYVNGDFRVFNGASIEYNGLTSKINSATADDGRTYFTISPAVFPTSAISVNIICGANMAGAHAEGVATRAIKGSSHAEGSYTLASGDNSHSEGYITTASGKQSHAEGFSTVASGERSHAEGASTTASGRSSHAEGTNTIAKNRSQHVFGEYNIEDPSTSSATAKGTFIEIVGNGTNNNTRSNARTLDWSGNEVLSGNLTVNGTTLTVNGQQIEPQVQADWNQTTTTANDYIKNKPTIPTQTSNLINDGEGGSSGPFVTSDELATIATSGNFSDLEGATSSDEGKILSVNSQGEFNLINCDEPLTSQEIDNILT